MAPRRRPTAAVMKRIALSANTKIREFMGSDLPIQTLEKEFPGHEIANFQILIRQFFEQEIPGAVIVGTRSSSSSLFGNGHRLEALLAEAHADKDGEFEGVEMCHLHYVKAVSEEIDARLGLASGLVFCEFHGQKLVVYFQTESEVRKRCQVGVITHQIEAANELLMALDAYLLKNSIYRRRMLVPSVSYSSELEEVSIVKYEKTRWEDLILPDDLKMSIYENIVTFIRNADIIKRNGFELKRGVLFHGTPGTGKSLACRVLTSELSDFTTILVTGEDQRRPKPIFEMARRLQPSIIIYEDIDNLAAKREDNGLRNTLSDLMNELDGLSARENVYVLFTTNFIQYLESALVERPGRVDLIYEFPVPGPELRRKLIHLFAMKARVAVSNWGFLLDQTDQTSPAFIKELVKHALLHSIRNGGVDPDGIADLRDADFACALSGLQGITNPSVKRIVGFGE